MQKDELIQLHTFLYQMRTHVEQLCENNGLDIANKYEKLEITPYQIHKSKREHKLAVFTLSKDIAGILSGNNGDSGLEKIANRLVTRLDAIKESKAKRIPWRWINKEILSESAKELDLDPAEIEYVFKFEKKNFFDDILSSQSHKYYKSDRRIRQTVARVVRNIATEGNVIIIGRGGVIWPLFT